MVRVNATERDSDGLAWTEVGRDLITVGIHMFVQIEEFEYLPTRRVFLRRCYTLNSYGLISVYGIKRYYRVSAHLS